MTRFVAIVALPSELSKDLWTFSEPLIYSGVGKLNASIATLGALDKFKPEFILNLGTVGSMNENLSGIIEIGRVLQRDFDATPLSPKGQVPYDEKPQILFSDTGEFSCGTGDTFVRSKEDWLLENQIDVVEFGYGLPDLVEPYRLHHNEEEQECCGLLLPFVTLINRRQIQRYPHMYQPICDY